MKRTRVATVRRLPVLGLLAPAPGLDIDSIQLAGQEGLGVVIAEGAYPRTC